MENFQDLLREKVFSKYQKDTWEIRTLGEIATEIISGSEVTKEQLGSGDYPSIKCGDINSSLPLQFKECKSFVDLNLIKKPKYFEKGDLLLSNMGGKDTVGTPVVYLGKEKCLAGDHVIVIKTNQNTKFLAYILSSSFAKAQIEKLAQKSTVYDLYPSKIKQIKIPLPSLEIQQEIVEFLDKYIELERELERELEMRKKQYEYYKNLLINRGIEELNWDLKTIDEIALEIYNGSEVTKDQMNTGDYPAIKYKNIYDYESFLEECNTWVNLNLIKRKKYCEYGDILIAGVSNKKGTVGKSIAYIGKEKCIVGNEIEVLKHNQNPKYLSYCLSSNFAISQKEKQSQGGAIFNIHIKDVKKIMIPIPSTKEQKRVVDSLDMLHKIVFDEKEGIPFLIRKNKEQYEFYRELLLER